MLFILVKSATLKNDSVMTELQAIKETLKDELGSVPLAVERISKLLSRSPSTVYMWLSDNDRNIPDSLLELLRYKLNGD